MAHPKCLIDYLYVRSRERRVWPLGDRDIHTIAIDRVSGTGRRWLTMVRTSLFHKWRVPLCAAPRP